MIYQTPIACIVFFFPYTVSVFSVIASAKFDLPSIHETPHNSPLSNESLMRVAFLLNLYSMEYWRVVMESNSALESTNSSWFKYALCRFDESDYFRSYPRSSASAAAKTSAPNLEYETLFCLWIVLPIEWYNFLWSTRSEIHINRLFVHTRCHHPHVRRHSARRF